MTTAIEFLIFASVIALVITHIHSCVSLINTNQKQRELLNELETRLIKLAESLQK